MESLDERIESIATHMIIVELDDLPSLANLHEKFISLENSDGDQIAILSEAAHCCGHLIEKIILNKTEDKKATMSIISDTVECMQAIVRDKRDIYEVSFPSELGLTSDCSKSENTTPENTTEEQPVKNTQNDTLEKSEDSSASEETKSEALIVSIDDSDTSLLGEFITEGREHCALAEQMLMDLEGDTENKEAIDAIFRGFHTIKGAAGFLDLKPISVLAHESETLLDMVRKGEIVIKDKIADTIFKSIDSMRELFDGVENTIETGDPFDGSDIVLPLVKKLKKLIAGTEDPDEDESPARVGDVLVDMGVVSKSEVEDALTKKETPQEKVGEALVRQGKVNKKSVKHALNDQKQIKKTKAIKEMVKIDTERLDKLVDTIGELVIAESMVGQDEKVLSIDSTITSKNISHLNKITRELQEMGMAMRLVPVKSTFQKLARAVRDLASKSGKKVNLTLSGEDSEVDRSIVENIGDPLMHMVRNSIDHGLESTKDRIKAGKSETGQVWIRAYHKGGNINMEIEDDGKGLDKERILAKATERGLITGNKELTDKEIYNMILLPGFSTAAKVTSISGRGVGMDVVKRNIEAMRGNLEIESEAGKGSKFIMKLPLTLAMIDGMLVRVEKEQFIIPTISVVESLHLKPDMISTVSARKEIINLRGNLIPLIRTARIFGFQDRVDYDSECVVVVVENGEKLVGLVIDELLGQRQTVIKSLGSVFEEQKWISGGAILSNGNVGLIIDISGLVELAASNEDVIINRIPSDIIDDCQNESSSITDDEEIEIGELKPVVN